MKKSKKYYIYQMNSFTINAVSIVLLILLIIFATITTPYLLSESLISIANINLLLFFILFFAYLILHEILHSIAYVIYGGKYNKIVYGMSLEKGILYCLCKQNVTRRNILHSLMYPLFFIGIVTYIISIIFNLPLLFALSIFNLIGCGGDIIMFIFISKLDKDIMFTELDDEMSFAIYADKDISKNNHFGLKYLGVKNNIERNDLEKIRISKASKIIILVLLILCIIALFI